MIAALGKWLHLALVSFGGEPMEDREIEYHIARLEIKRRRLTQQTLQLSSEIAYWRQRLARVNEYPEFYK